MRKFFLGCKKRLPALISTFVLGMTSMFSVAVPVFAATIDVDGNPKEWSNIQMMDSVDSNVAKWAVAQDDTYVYFYVQMNGGNQWGLPITSTYISLEYASGRKDANSEIRFAGMMDEIKNAHYGTIGDTKQAYAPSDEANKYEAEFAVPKSYFGEEDYVIHYCGDTVNSSDIADLTSMDDAEEVVPVYSGIQVDGNFTDWRAVAKTDIDREYMTQAAMVFDGDYVYIYMKETDPGALTASGNTHDGKFTLLTDLGRNTPFKLNLDSIDGIEGAKVAHSNCQYEIAIPASAIKQFKDTISFGYYMEEEMLIKDVANLQGTDSDKDFNGIRYDGDYSDWEYYPHHLIQYSTQGAHESNEGVVGDDAEGALYVDGTTLYGHVISFLHLNTSEFSPFSIRINEDDDLTLRLCLLTADEEGYINYDPKLDDLEPGTYEFYIRNYEYDREAKKVDDENSEIYGKMYVTIRETADGASISDEMEFQMDIEKMAKHFNMDATDFKLIQAQYIEIGTEWVSTAGTSTGALMGISICGAVVLGVLFYRKKKNQNQVA